MTEATGVIASIGGDFLTDKPNSCGPILPTFQAKCVDDVGCVVPKGEIGELWLKGATVFNGYYNEPVKTEEILKDGWLQTGDLARIDQDGFLYIVDRKKDMVLRGGENVFCAEVEAVLQQHPAVEECCVFAIPHDRLGETVGAAVRTNSEKSSTTPDLQKHCAPHLAAYKVPEEIWVLEEQFPRNASGKILKQDIRKIALASRN